MVYINRLRKRADFVRLTNKRKNCAASTLVLQCDKTPEEVRVKDSIRLGFTVTKKVGNAVVRNRIKRRLRAAASQIMPKLALPDYDYVLIGRKNALTSPYEIIIRDMKYALKKVHKNE